MPVIKAIFIVKLWVITLMLSLCAMPLNNPEVEREFVYLNIKFRV